MRIWCRLITHIYYLLHEQNYRIQNWHLEIFLFNQETVFKTNKQKPKAFYWRVFQRALLLPVFVRTGIQDIWVIFYTVQFSSVQFSPLTGWVVRGTRRRFSGDNCLQTDYNKSSQIMREPKKGTPAAADFASFARIHTSVFHLRSLAPFLRRPALLLPWMHTTSYTA